MSGDAFVPTAQGGLALADLRGADLRRRRLEHLSLVGARLDGADLRDATLAGVDLSNASLRGARLEGAKLRLVDASYADLTGVDLSHSHWNLCDLSHVDLRGARLVHAFIRDSALRDADLGTADLSDARLFACDCSASRLVEAILERTGTAGSDFRDAELTGARRFWRSRELVAEVLRRGIGDEVELEQLVGAVLTMRRRCWPEWRDWLASRPHPRSVALAAFNRYPDSGCREALLGTGADGEPSVRRRTERPVVDAASVEPGRVAPDWDALAPVWHLFEHDGLNPAHLELVGDLLRPPVLVIGGGGGVVAHALVERFGEAAVIAVDRSLAMCRRAQHDRGITVMAADGAELPVADGRFATVLCTTGVLEYVDDGALATLLAEMARTCTPDGNLIVAAASSDAGIEWEVPQLPFIERWYEGRSDPGSEVTHRLDAVAIALGGRTEARDVLSRGLPPVGSSVTDAGLEAAADRADLVITAAKEVDGMRLWHLVVGRGYQGPPPR